MRGACMGLPKSLLLSDGALRAGRRPRLRGVPVPADHGRRRGELPPPQGRGRARHLRLQRLQTQTRRPQGRAAARRAGSGREGGAAHQLHAGRQVGAFRHRRGHRGGRRPVPLRGQGAAPGRRADILQRVHGGPHAAGDPVPGPAPAPAVVLDRGRGRAGPVRRPHDCGGLRQSSQDYKSGCERKCLHEQQTKDDEYKRTSVSTTAPLIGRFPANRSVRLLLVPTALSVFLYSPTNPASRAHKLYFQMLYIKIVIVIIAKLASPHVWACATIIIYYIIFINSNRGTGFFSITLHEECTFKLQKPPSVQICVSFLDVLQNHSMPLTLCDTHRKNDASLKLNSTETTERGDAIGVI